MNELMQKNQQSMTSLQIADLVKKRHDSVKRSVERIAEKGVITLPPLVETSFKDFIGKTQRTTTYVFSGEQGKRDSIVVVAQLSPELTALLVDRWRELERLAQASQPVIPALPQSFSEALLLAGKLQQQIEHDAPKISFYDKLADSSVLMAVGDVSKKIGLSAYALNQKMIPLGVYDKTRLPKKVFRQWFIDQGLGEMKTTDEGRSRNLLTTKGQAWVFERFGAEVA